MIKHVPSPIPMPSKNVREGDYVWEYSYSGKIHYSKRFPLYSERVPPGSLREFVRRLEEIVGWESEKFESVDDLGLELNEIVIVLDNMCIEESLAEVDVMLLQTGAVDSLSGASPGGSEEVADFLDVIAGEIDEVLAIAFGDR